MLQSQTIKDFFGFGSGRKAGEYHYSQNLKRVQDGLAPAWAPKLRTSNSLLSGLDLINWFIERSGVVYLVDALGHIFSGTGGGSDDAWASAHAPSGSHGQGLITDQVDRLLYIRDTTLGMYDGTTWTDSWQTFDTTVTDLCPADLFEDWVAIARGNKVALLNVTDDSFNNTGFDLPSGFKIRCLKAGKSGILLGANFQNRGYLVLWTPDSDRSLAPWIPLDTTVSSLAVDDTGNWLVTTARGILKTNGYSIVPYASLPGSKLNDRLLKAVYPGGTLYHDKRLFVALTSISTPLPRLHQGLYAYDELTGLWNFIATSSQQVEDMTMTAMFLDSNLDIYAGYQTTVPSVANIVDRLREGVSTRSVFISPVMADGPTFKHAEAIMASFLYDSIKANWVHTYNWTVTAKIYDFKRELYGYGFSATIAPALNQFVNTAANASFQGAQVGDEVIFLSGQNAGEIRTIIAINNPDTNTETWTFDSNLPNLTGTNVRVEITPFKLISVRTMSALEPFFFDIKNRPKGKRFLIKLIIESPAGQPQALPVLNNLAFIFNETPIT